jgi:hypothetical protein
MMLPKVYFGKHVKGLISGDEADPKPAASPFGHDTTKRLDNELKERRMPDLVGRIAPGQRPPLAEFPALL